jgi:mannosyltransferase OCH1-like enzyme
VRLALLIKHGGVYMDASFILLQDLEWLINIAAYPSQFIFNRYGDLPSVFIFYNPHYGSQFD